MTRRAKFICFHKRVLLGLGLSLVFANAGCITGGYRLAGKDVLPAVALNFAGTSPVPPAPPSTGSDTASRLAPPPATLHTVIVYHGPGSWKKEAFWDEYVVSVTNSSATPLLLATAELVSAFSAPVPPGADPWKLDRLGKTWWQTNGGQQTKTYLLLGTGTVGGAGVGLAGLVSGGIFGPMTTAGTVAFGVGTLTVVALPVLAIGSVGRNIHGKHQIEKEFFRRRIALPLSLAPGQSVQGSLFFPITPGPRKLTLNGHTGDGPREIVIDLAPLAGLHLPLPAIEPKPSP
ncbi:MAG: hypothetical protein ABIZ81_14455 [Opitutaceae bacterium]